MVFTTAVSLIRIRGPDRFWRRRRILRMSAHFGGRRWNCYTIAIRTVHRALVFSTKSRKLKKADMRELWNTRLTAACEEHGLPLQMFKESLVRSNILLNNKVLADLAIWEPKTFKSLVTLAWSHARDEGLNGINSLGDPPEGVFTRHMLKY